MKKRGKSFLLLSIKKKIKQKYLAMKESFNFSALMNFIWEEGRT